MFSEVEGSVILPGVPTIAFNIRMRRFSITKDRRNYNSPSAVPPGLSLLSLLATILPLAASESGSSDNSIRWRHLSQSEMPAVPDPEREFRGMWVATVYNLDWPSKPGLPVETQQDELLEILDRVEALNMNAVVFQVRTMCDAFYASPLEPWSYYLTGELGEAPEPFWDPLAFAVEAAHERGIELHAWFNPFRATTAAYGDVMPDSHIISNYPWLARPSGRHQWLDPSSEFVRERILTVIYDVVNRYDVDAIHLDDYFYPYPAKGEDPGLDDEENWQRYRFGEALRTDGQPMDRNEWRRHLVNELIRDLYGDIKATKPWVKVGISPFGIWRSGHPEDIRGMDAYEQIFADSRRWIREGWVDYFSPQLYWRLKGPQSFDRLYRWWQEQNRHGRHLWPGIAASRLGRGGEGQGWKLSEVFGQIEATREFTGSAPGSGQLYWHWEAFATNRGGISKQIHRKHYTDRALSPPSPWLAADEGGGNLGKVTALPLAVSFQVKPPLLDEAGEKDEADDDEIERPRLDRAPNRDEWRLAWDTEGGTRSQVRWWVVQVGSRGKAAGDWRWRTERIVNGSRRACALGSVDEVDAIAIRAVDAVGTLGRVRVIERFDGET